MVTRLLPGRFLSLLPIPTDFRERNALELEDFPEYIAELNPSQRQKIDNLAVEIVRSNDTNDPIFEFRVEGHADVARRIANKAERKWFEDNISKERADNAFDVLADALKLRGGEALAQKILKGSKAFGLGTQNLKVPNAATEAQFRKNRRVVFIVRQVTFIPPPPPPPPPPSSIIEDRFTVKLIRGGAVTLGDFGIESVTVTATIEITDNIDKKSAQFISASTGGGFGGGPFPINVSINFDPGEEVPFKTFRLTRTPIGLNSFEGMVTVFVDPGTGIGPASKGATLSFSFDGLQTNGANTMPQVIRVAAGNSSLTGPTIGLGAVTIGRLTMKGTPADL